MTGVAVRGWQVENRIGDAVTLHGLDIPEPASRQVWVMQLARPALVLGSTQKIVLVRSDVADERGIDVVTRRSGGGAVLLDPATTLWVDVILPRGDALWEDDVTRSFDWLGATWARALTSFVAGPSTHHGAMLRSPESALVCFAGLGPGEVTVDSAKVVGISQRRTRGTARFQSVVYLGPAAGAGTIVDLLAEPREADARQELRRRLDRDVRAIHRSSGDVVRAFVAALPV